MKRLLLFAALIAWSGMASAVVYKWVDAQGKLQYGDRPPDGVHAEVVELLIPHSASTRSASTPAAPAAKNTAVPTAKDLDDKKAVDQDVAKTRDKQCNDAQDRYKKTDRRPQALQNRPGRRTSVHEFPRNRHRAAQRQTGCRYHLQQHDLSANG